MDGLSEDASSYNITGLTNGIAYHFQIRAVNAEGAGPWTERVTVTPGVPPDAPSIDSLTPGDGVIAVAWSAPADAGSSAITGYDLRYVRGYTPDKSSANWTVLDSVWTSGELSYTITGLDANTRYNVQIRAVNFAGNGP